MILKKKRIKILLRIPKDSKPNTERQTSRRKTQQHRQVRASWQVYGLNFSSSSSVVGIRSILSYMLLFHVQQQKLYKFLHTPLLNGYTLSGISLQTYPTRNVTFLLIHQLNYVWSTWTNKLSLHYSLLTLDKEYVSVSQVHMWFDLSQQDSCTTKRIIEPKLFFTEYLCIFLWNINSRVDGWPDGH